MDNAQSSSVLETLFPGISRDRFLQEYWLGDRHLVVHGDPDRFTSLVDVPEVELEDLLRRQKASTTCSLRDRHGQQRHFHSLPTDQVLEMYECGATVHLDGFEQTLDGGEHAWGRLAQELGLRRELLRCTAFAATGPGPGSPQHCDNKDIFIIHVAGTKRWRVGPNTDIDTPTKNVWPWGAPGITSLRKVRPELTTIDLEPGSVLFLPRGQWHMTEVTSSSCFAITVGFERPTWLQILEATLHNRLRHDRTWREAVGSAWGTPKQQAAVRDQFAIRLRRLADELAHMEPWALFGEVVNPRLGTEYVRAPTVTVTIDERGSDGSAWSVAIRGENQTESLAVDDPQVIAIVRWILSREETFTHADLSAAFPDCDRAALRGLVAELVRNGLVDSLPQLSAAVDLATALNRL